MANPKAIIDKNDAPKRIQKNLFKHDQLTHVIKKELEDKTNHLDVREKYLFDIAQFLIDQHEPKNYDLGAMYSLVNIDRDQTNNIADVAPKKDSAQLEEQLKKFRLEMARRENLKAYMIFTNKEMEDS